MPLSRFIRRLLCLLAALLSIAGGRGMAQEAEASPWARLGDPVFRRVALPQGMLVTTILQDDQGLLWLGSQNGLVRWDGYRYRTYNASPGVAGSLPDSFVTALHEDPQHRLWIGTSAGGLALRDAAHDRFELAATGPEGLSHGSIFAIEDDGRGGLWIGTGAGLDHFDPRTQKVLRQADGARAQGLPDGAVQAVLPDADGGLWVGTRHGVYRRAAGASRFVPVLLPVDGGDVPAVSRLLRDRAGRVWIGTRPRGVYVIDAGQDLARQVRDTESGGEAGLQTDSVFALAEGADGAVWAGTPGAGLVRVDPRTWTTHRMRHREGAAADLSDDDVQALYTDRSGLLWVATDDALNAYDPLQAAVTTWFGAEGSARGISHRNVPFVLAMPDGTAWLSLGDGGVDIVDPQRGRIGQIRFDATHPATALPKGRVLSMTRAPGGEVYLGTQQGLYKVDGQGRNVVRVEVPGRPVTAATWALCIVGDTLWLGGLDGLRGMPLEGGAPVRIDTALPDTRVTWISLADAHHLWVGTRAGLARYGLDDGRVETLPVDTPEHVGYPRGYITGVFDDRQGRLWVASFGGGVRVVVPPAKPGAAPTLRRIGVREGLPNDGVNAMLMDARGDVWLSTDNGLVRVAGDTLALTVLQVADGVGIPSYWATAGAATPQGDLLFGGNGGMTIVRPSLLRPWRWHPPVVVTQADVAGVERVPSRAPLELDPSQREIAVEFSALDYSQPEANRYAYRLDGFDRDWISVDPTRRLAHYTNLAPGDYVLELRGSNRQGVFSPPLRWPVRVLPAWYETLWFRGLVALAVFVALAGVVQGRTVILRRREQVLRRLVAERTATLEQRSEELRDSERRLEQMAYFDSLTGLANRRLFNDEMQRLRLLARRGEPFTLLLIDLDRFKAINDTHGHDAGDALLVEIAARLKNCVREIDCVARLGGDEFAVLLLRTADRESVDAICQRIVDSLDRPVRHGERMLRTSASIGAAACADATTADEALYKRADLALYEAKNAGRRCWRWDEREAESLPR